MNNLLLIINYSYEYNVLAEQEAEYLGLFSY